MSRPGINSPVMSRLGINSPVMSRPGIINLVEGKVATEMTGHRPHMPWPRIKQSLTLPARTGLAASAVQFTWCGPTRF